METMQDRAREVVNSVGFTENAEAAIAAALQQVADECAECVEEAPLDYARPDGDKAPRGRYHFAAAIRARFPRESDAE